MSWRFLDHQSRWKIVWYYHMNRMWQLHEIHPIEENLGLCNHSWLWNHHENAVICFTKRYERSYNLYLYIYNTFSISLSLSPPYSLLSFSLWNPLFPDFIAPVCMCGAEFACISRLNAFCHKYVCFIYNYNLHTPCLCMGYGL